ncbi:heavy metal translocating P-type ATPase [Anoxynatronum sibiricum]|uniref:Cd(2+)-exporting ATPase n=1 Tax=Anoxynatronum sibiricum TaxID=210623 RepID=A0ABU9VPH6_9CLOT
MNSHPHETYRLKGLGCADCAGRMEREISQINGVADATVDFVTQRLTVYFLEKDRTDEIIKETASVIQRIEPDVRIVPASDYQQKEDHSHEFPDDDNQWKTKGMMAAAFLLFAAPWTFKLEGNLALTLYLAAYVLSGGRVLLRAGRNLMNGRVFDENFLMSVATIGAFAIGEYPEGVAVMLFYQVGEYFQDLAVHRSRKSIAALMDIRPDTAHLIQDGRVQTVKPEQVDKGQLILVKPGEKVPMDGVIVKGISLVDTAALTGESLPRDVSSGDEVLGGFVNQSGALTIKVNRTYEHSAVSKILELVQTAGSRKARTEQFITKFAQIYTPLVVGAAVMLAVIPPLLLADATFGDWVYRALIFLVISCPCALVISIPLGFFGGIGGASSQGILVKGGNYLEALNQVDTIIFDKTGTLTKGIFRVSHLLPQEGIDEPHLLEMAALVESQSTHPISVSIQKAWGGNTAAHQVDAVRETPGKGVEALVDGQRIRAGNAAFMKEAGINAPQVAESGTLVHVVREDQLMGSLVISDEMRPGVRETMEGLRRAGIKRLVMLTGDREMIARQVGEAAGISEIYAELLPQDKVTITEKIMAEQTGKRKVMVVGDGINDAPVLARADVGTAMGGLGSDAAIEAADVVIMDDEPARLITALKIARRTRIIVWQNIVLAIGVKLIVLALGAGGLATIWEAVFADVGVAVLATLNAMRVMKTPRQK